jgi:hypothetical protein
LIAQSIGLVGFAGAARAPGSRNHGGNRGRYRIHENDFAEGPTPGTTAVAIAHRELAEAAARRVGSSSELARPAGSPPSHIARLRKGLVGAGVETLLNLADVLDLDPVNVLHVCGHTGLAERFIRLQHNAPPRALTALCETIGRLSNADRELIGAIAVRLLPLDRMEPIEVAPPVAPRTRRPR